MLIISFAGRDYPVYDSVDEFRKSIHGVEMYSEFKRIRRAKPYRSEHLAGLQVLVGKWIVSDDGRVTQCLGVASSILGNIILQTPAGAFNTSKPMNIGTIKPTPIETEASRMLAVLMMFALTKDLDSAIRLVLKHAPSGRDIERLLEFIHGNDVFLTHHARIMELIGLNDVLESHGLNVDFALKIYREIGENGTNREKIMVADRVVALNGFKPTKLLRDGVKEDAKENTKENTKEITNTEFSIVDDAR